MSKKKTDTNKVSYESYDKTPLCGILSMPKETRDFALLAHGITVNKDEWNGFYVDMANELAKNNIGSLRFDFRGHGESGGTSLDISVIGDILDVKGSISFIQEYWNGRMGLVATSFGAGPALLTAVQMPDIIKLIVLIAPVLDYEATFIRPRTEWARSYFNKKALQNLPKRGYLPFEGQFRLSPKLIEEFQLIKPYEALSQLHMPILMIHGEKDSMVPFEISEKYAQVTNGIKFLPLPNADHGFVDSEDENGDSPKSRANEEKIFREIIQFFRENA